MPLLYSFPPTSSRPSGLAGAADALWLAECARQGAPLAVICASAWDAQRLTEELRWFDPALRVCIFPDWETLPYDNFSPHPDLISERLATLYQVSRGEFDVLVVALTTALVRLAPPTFLAAHTFFIKQKDRLDEAAFRAQMTLGGYTHVNQVYAPGEFSIRGGLIDLFPMGSALPYRIDLFDDEIETLRAFDVDTQRSLYPVPEIRLLPAREFPLDDAGVTRFRQQFREKFEGDPSKSKLYKDVSNRLAPAGIEYALPLFFEATATLFDYLPANASLVMHGTLDEAGQAFWADAQGRHRLLSGDRDRPLLPPAELFLPVDAFFARAKDWPQLHLTQGGSGPAQAVPPISVDRREAHPVARLAGFIDGFDGRTVIVAPSAGRRETLHEYLAEHDVAAILCDDWAACLASSARVLLTHGPLAEGFVTTDGALAVVTETELYAIPPRTRRAREARATQIDNLLRDLSELKPGDPVVHAQYGVGQYLGLVNMDLGDGDTEFLHLEYARGDKLYVPVANLHLISRYSGAGDGEVPLHKLGTDQWEKARRRAMQAARDTAAELLNLYALRAAREGHAFQFSPHDYEAFAEGFGYEETPDQAAAIAAVMADMQSGKPMDRLVCGDVGFGKTEVALRAAFMAVMGGYQVAVLVPTTLLAEQHFQNFSDRFSAWPVKLAELSRFRTPKEQAEALDALKAGKLDIVIGTHRLIQKDVKFARLGLVILDEEHRFGVRQKEQLKALRAEVDVLTLTATPIPRTLAMSLEGIRDFSVIATAPQKRLSIKTFVQPFSGGLIREAVLRELKRGGQVYFLHNEVSTIENMRERLEKLLPEARIRVGHGQMGERELEQAIRDFYQQRYDILLCTTIIETGIDIPTANTILINRADKFGLAQLHQLRGRVGRSHHQAFAYLLVEEDRNLTPQAKKRLEAIQLMEELGSGFHLAMQDMEIRGMGEVLGDKQSGDILEVGFSLYNDMLTSAVASLKAGQEPDMSHPLGVVSEINLHLPALLPADYCPDVHERLVLYKRLASCNDSDNLRAMQEELIDRFGSLPDAARVLFDIHRLRLATRALGIVKVDADSDAVTLNFITQPPIDPARIIKLIQTRRDIKLAGENRLRWQTASTPDTRTSTVLAFFDLLR
ncbi:MAG: transcription-repair coupling factor [Hydrogenophilales bacterium 16-64-46]|nr:MAG: transcription-repair coupling factor [Hydrogenophilales bacterium 12-64-13]OYZ05624.1 MAG: transcription-repair coupling factor [Hydrogenophilales bacterium 16-64-46]OZA40203.1 MAG: transcription-repair coupling factor [Hydrogenophilales bacterium 17-64-34]HQT00751.1 transcription-repair coupling factor [Thiobacillus sp.]